MIRTYQGSELVSEEVYDLVFDSGEINPVPPTSIEGYAELNRELSAFVEPARSIDRSSFIPLDSEMWEKLRALGYPEGVLEP